MNTITHSCGCDGEAPCPKAWALFVDREWTRLRMHLEASMLINGVPIYDWLKGRRSMELRASIGHIDAAKIMRAGGFRP